MFFNFPWLQNDFDVDPDSAEGTLHPGLLGGRNKCEKLAAKYQMPMQPVKRTRDGSTESSNVSDLPPLLLNPYDLVFKNPQGSDVDFEVAEPQGINQDAALIGPGVAEMPDVDPIRNNGCRRGKSAYRHRRECDGIDVHQPSCDFASFANKILVMTALEVYTDSVEAVGAFSRQADVGRPVKIDKSSQGQSVGVAEGAV